MTKPCIFFDRDGIINVPPDPARYVTRVDRFFIIPDFIEALRVVANLGYSAVVVTNQRGVALGEMPMEEVDRIHRKLRDRLAEEGLALLDILVCPFDDDAHSWRKPNPGMLVEAARRHELDLSRSWMIGDSEGDIEAGNRAGCRTIRVAPLDRASAADHRVADMGGLPRLLTDLLTPATERPS